MKRTTRISIAVALTIFLVATGTGVSYALWATNASTSADVKTGRVLLSVGGDPADLALVYSPSAWAATAPVTISNDGTVDVAVTVTFTPNATPPLPTSTLPPSSVTVDIWEAADCTTTAVPTWSGTLGGPIPIGSLPAAGGTAPNVMDLCVRTSVISAETHQGEILAGDLVFTGTNGWVSSASLAINQSVYAVPELTGSITCAQNGNNKITLSWGAANGAVDSYQVNVSPEDGVNYPNGIYLSVPNTVTSAPIVTTPFDLKDRQPTGVVTVYSVVDGWLSTGASITIYFHQSSASNGKINCLP